MVTIFANTKFMILFGFFSLLAVQLSEADFFTAVADMEVLIETQAILIANLESYIEKQEETLNFIRK